MIPIINLLREIYIHFGFEEALRELCRATFHPLPDLLIFLKMSCDVVYTNHCPDNAIVIRNPPPVNLYIQGYSYFP